MIKRIGIIGAGAVGCSLGSAFYEKYGDQFCFVAQGERAKKLKQNGIIVNHINLFPKVHEEPEEQGVDLLLLCVKNYSLEDTLQDIAPLIHENTILLPLLNGVTAVDRVRAAFPNNPVPYGIVMRTDAERIDHTVSVSIRGEIQIGYARGETPDCDLDEIRDLFIQAGIDSKIYPDMRYMLWRKWMINIGANQVSALTCAKFKYFGKVEEIIVLLKEAIREILEISQKFDIGLTAQDCEDIVQILINYPPEKKTSMFQDIEARRRTEIDYFAGTVIELGKKVGVPTPVNWVMYHALKAREQIGMAELKAEQMQNL